MQQQRISNTNGLITQAQYAKRLGVQRSTISRQVHKGVIPTHGPRRLIDPAEADGARKANLWLGRGRNRVDERQQPAESAAVAPNPPSLLDGFTPEVLQFAITIYEAMRAQFTGIANILAEAGMPLEVAVAAPELIDSLIGVCIFRAGLDDLIDEEQYGLPDVDAKALAKRHGLKVPRDLQQRVDAIFKQIDPVIERMSGVPQ